MKRSETWGNLPIVIGFMLRSTRVTNQGPLLPLNPLGLKMSDTLITALVAFGAAVLGAVVGGLISYLLQRQALAAATAQHDSDRNEVRKALALSLVFKMIRISSDLNNLGKSILELMERAKKGGFTGMPFQIVVPTVPLPDPVRFSPDEMAWVLSADNNLFNEMGPLDELHASTVAIFDLY